MREVEDKFADRINEIIGNGDYSFEKQLNIYFKYLKENLELPCEVIGIEDFNWEEFYVFGPGDEEEYEELKETQPSYTDIYELIDIEENRNSKWILSFRGDIAAKARRKSDNKIFWLGLSELETIDEDDVNYQLLDDYAVWFANL